MNQVTFTIIFGHWLTRSFITPRTPVTTKKKHCSPIAEAYLEPSQTSEMEHSVKIVKG